MAMRIYVDFNTITADPQDRVYINTCLDPNGIKFRQNLSLYRVLSMLGFPNISCM